MSDIVFIHNLRLNMVIGVYEWEKQISQPIDLDLDLYVDSSVAAQADDIKKTVNYKDVAEQITAYSQTVQPELIETLAENIATLLLDSFLVQRVKVTVKKPLAIKNAACVGVTIERGKTI